MITQVASIRPTDTNNAILWHVAAAADARQQKAAGGRGPGFVTIVNTTTSTAQARVFVSRFGDTYDQTTARAYDVPVPPNQSITIAVPGLCPDEQATRIAVRTGTASALTFHYDSEPM